MATAFERTRPYAAPAGGRSWPVAEVLILSAVALLLLLGFLMLYSVGRGVDAASTTFLRKQAIWLGFSLPVFLLVRRLDLVKLRRWVWPMAAGAVGLLVLVLIPGVGREVNGARRWLEFGPANLQVSDVAKLVLVFVLAHYLAHRQRRLLEFGTGFVYPSAIIGVFCILVILQPDFGTTALCGAVGGAMLFLSGARLRYLLPAAGSALALFSVAIFLDPVRLQRITSFLDVEGNRSGSAYQLWQGILGFGVGGWNGVGLGQGRQQLAFLPEAHTDFIFAIVGEELGLLATATTVLCFALIFVVVWLEMRKAPDLFQFLLVAGCLFLLTGQALINFGVTTGCLPTKGMSLPFVSYGGSNLLSMFVMLGIIMNCLRHWRRPHLREPLELHA